MKSQECSRRNNDTKAEFFVSISTFNKIMILIAIICRTFPKQPQHADTCILIDQVVLEVPQYGLYCLRGGANRLGGRIRTALRHFLRKKELSSKPICLGFDQIRFLPILPTQVRTGLGKKVIQFMRNGKYLL